MGSKHLRADVVLAWPTAEVAAMVAEGGGRVIFRRELAEADDAEVRREELADEYRARFANPYAAAERGYLDDVILPRESATRVDLRPRGREDEARAAAAAQAREHPACGRSTRGR